MPNIVIINNQRLKLLINLLIELTIKYHSGKIIPVAFRSGEFRGTFRYELRNARIPPEQETTGMTLLAEPPANFHSSGMHRIPPESPESGRNLWGTDKTSSIAANHYGPATSEDPSSLFHSSSLAGFKRPSNLSSCDSYSTVRSMTLVWEAQVLDCWR